MSLLIDSILMGNLGTNKTSLKIKNLFSWIMEHIPSTILKEEYSQSTKEWFVFDTKLPFLVLHTNIPLSSWSIDINLLVVAEAEKSFPKQSFLEQKKKRNKILKQLKTNIEYWCRCQSYKPNLGWIYMKRQRFIFLDRARILDFANSIEVGF